MLTEKLLDEFEDRCVKIYDPSTKSLIAVYQNYKKASNKLLLHPSTLRQKAKTRRRVFCEPLGIEIAVRVSSLGEKEQLLIEETTKNGIQSLTIK